MKTLSLFFKPSYYLATILSLFGLLVLAIILLMPFVLGLKTGFVLIGLIAMIYAIAKDALLMLPWSILQLEFSSQNEVRIVMKNKQMFRAEILHSSYINPYLTVLNFKLTGQFWQYHIVILPDSLSQDTFRQLRVRLLWSRQFVASDEVFADDF